MIPPPWPLKLTQNRGGGTGPGATPSLLQDACNILHENIFKESLPTPTQKSLTKSGIARVVENLSLCPKTNWYVSNSSLNRAHHSVLFPAQIQIARHAPRAVGGSRFLSLSSAEVLRCLSSSSIGIRIGISSKEMVAVTPVEPSQLFGTKKNTLMKLENNGRGVSANNLQISCCTYLNFTEAPVCEFVFANIHTGENWSGPHRLLTERSTATSESALSTVPHSRFSYKD